MTHEKEDDFLAEFFAAGRDKPLEPSADFLGRILSDAEQVQAGFASSETVVATSEGWFASMLGAIGGWPSLAGLATATVAGLWIGFSSPTTVDGLASGYLGVGETVELVDLFPDFDDLLLEG